MKRKLFTFLVAFLATLSGAVWGQEPIEVNLGDYNDDPCWITSDGIYHVTGSNKKGIQIKRGTTPTIILDGIKIEVTGAAIEVNGGAKPTFILQGVNKIVSEEGAAIRVPRDAEGSLRTGIVFSEASTGLLNIQVNNGGTAIGVKTAGQCGDITINGGTIQTNGKISNGATLDRDFTMSGNAVLITKEIDWNNAKKSINGGILFENTTIGAMYGDVTLNSPLPEGYVVDLTKTLTIGEGNSIYTDQIKENGGVLNAYKVMYADNLDEAWGVKPTNELPVTKYWGANYPVATWDAGINPNITSEKANATYKQVPAKWWDGSAWIEAGATPNTADATGIKDVTYGAAWYLAEFNPTYLDTEGLTDPRTLWVPVDASFEWEDIKNPNSLAQAGLKIEENQIIKDLTQPLQKGDYEINACEHTCFNMCY